MTSQNGEDVARRKCKTCRTPLVRKMRASGHERQAAFDRREYCDVLCRNMSVKPRQPASHPWVLAGLKARGLRTP